MSILSVLFFLIFIFYILAACFGFFISIIDGIYDWLILSLLNIGVCAEK